LATDKNTSGNRNKKLNLDAKEMPKKIAAKTFLHSEVRVSKASLKRQTATRQYILLLSKSPPCTTSCIIIGQAKRVTTIKTRLAGSFLKRERDKRKNIGSQKRF
jgi:hypothetical protein